MHILGQQISPFEAMLIQLLSRSLPGERTDIKAAKAATLAKVIVAEMARRGMTAINTGDIVGIQREYRWDQSELDAQMTYESLRSFPLHVAEVLEKHALMQMQQATEPGPNGGETVSVLRARVDILVPGYAEFKARAEKMNAPAGAA